MPGQAPSSYNVVDPQNSSSASLGSGGTFTGTYRDVSEFTSISINANSDVASTLYGVQIQWSADGITTHQIDPFTYDGPQFYGAGFTNGETWHVPVRMKFMKIVYTNGVAAQGNFALQILLRKGPAFGSIQRITPGEQFSTFTLEGQTVLGLNAVQDYNNDEFIIVSGSQGGLAVGQAAMWVDYPQTSLDLTRAPAQKAVSVTSIAISPGFGGGSRRWATCVNDTQRSTLYLRFDGAASLTNYHWKVAPQCTWTMPQSWSISSADLFGIWDLAEPGSFAYYSEMVR